jgi:hypothetical protein
MPEGLYAGLGSTITLGVPPRAADESGLTVPSAPADDDLKSYQALFTASAERRRGLFADLQRMPTPDGAYLGQWRRSMVGCC